MEAVCLALPVRPRIAGELRRVAVARAEEDRDAVVGPGSTGRRELAAAAAVLADGVVNGSDVLGRHERLDVVDRGVDEAAAGREVVDPPLHLVADLRRGSEREHPLRVNAAAPE